jgi:hypothetical protein
VITLDVRLAGIRVPVLLGTGPILDRAAIGAIRALDPDRVLMVVDAVVARLYPEDLKPAWEVLRASSSSLPKENAARTCLSCGNCQGRSWLAGRQSVRSSWFSAAARS